MIEADGFPTRILIVDDRERVRQSLRSRIAMTSGSYLVQVAAGGGEVLEHPRLGDFDVVLCDLRLRGELDGIDVTRTIRERHPETRVVVFSGQDEGARKLEALAAGAYAYLSKPINHDELLHAIRTINSIRRTERLRRGFETLAGISYELQGSFDFEHLTRRIVDGARELGYRRSRLYLFDRERRILVGKVARGMAEHTDFEKYEIPFAASPMIAAIFEQDRPTLWNEQAILERFGSGSTEPWMSDLELRGLTWIDCPLLVGNRRVGTLSVDHHGRDDHPYTDDDRRILGVFSGMAAQALHNSRLYEKEALANASLRSILRDAPDAVVATDLDGTMTFVSRSSERVLGYPWRDMLRRRAADFYTDEAGSPEVGREVAAGVMRELRQAGTISNRRVFVRREPRGTRPVSLSVSLLRDEEGEAIGTLGFLRDLGPTEVRSRQYRDLLEGFGYGSLLLGRGGAIDFVNRKAARLLRRPRQELFGRGFSELVGEPQRAELERGLAAVLKEGGEVSLDLGLLQGDGRRLPVKATLTPVASGGSPRGVAVALHDQSELGALIQSGRLMALGQMVAGVAHEVNNPLNHILLAAREIEEDIARGELSAEDTAEPVEMILRNGRRIRDVVRQLRQLAHPGELRRRPISLGEVVRDSLAFFAARFRHHDIELVTELAPDLPKVEGDAPRLQQVVVNLIANAEEAMAGQRGPKRVEITTRRAAPRRVLLAVADTGGGVPEEIREQIFDPFFTTKAPNQGTGLGLSISKSIIDLHEGTIRVVNAGGGARFEIELPGA